jgi:hypothetical protein
VLNNQHNDSAVPAVVVAKQPCFSKAPLQLAAPGLNKQQINLEPASVAITMQQSIKLLPQQCCTHAAEVPSAADETVCCHICTHAPTQHAVIHIKAYTRDTCWSSHS